MIPKVMANKAPLCGIRILDLTRLLPGPLATLFLADLGAEVIKIEEPTRGDETRNLPPGPKQGSGFVFQVLNRDKNSCTLDLKTEKGRKKFLKMVKTADILIEGFRPGVMKKLALSYQEISSLNPKIIYCSITGYGQTGSLSSLAGHDLNYLSLAGLIKDQPLPTTVGDVAGGSLMSLVAILTALFQRTKTNKGTYIDISITRSMLALNPLAWIFSETQTPDYLTGTNPCYTVYPTSDRKFIAFACLEAKFFDRFCDAVNKPQWKKLHSQQEQWNNLRNSLSDLFKGRSQEYWWELSKRKDCCCTPVLSLKESLKWAEKNYSIELSLAGHPPIQTWTIPFQFDNWSPQHKKSSPELGEHNSLY